MYARNGALGTTAAGGTVASLAGTGAGMVWMFLSAFALLGAGLALLRLIPRHEG